MSYREQLTKSIDKDYLKRPGVQRVRRGDSVAYAIGDDVFAFLSDDGLVLKLEEAERAALLRTPNARRYEDNKPGRHEQLVELVIDTFMDVMTGMEWVRRAYGEAAKRAAPAKGHRRGLFSH
jgi:TfoX/Sxy family transcriptional regulator of competence genes